MKEEQRVYASIVIASTVKDISVVAVVKETKPTMPSAWGPGASRLFSLEDQGAWGMIV